MKRGIVYTLWGMVILLAGTIYMTTIKRTQGFAYHKIHSRYGYESRWDLGGPNPEQEKLLDRIAEQSFTLLGSGKECYAFVSEDGEIVVKFFKQKHMRTQYPLNYFPRSKNIRRVREEMLTRRSNLRKKLYTSYQIARERLAEETGVLFLHLTKTKHLKRSIKLIKPDGKPLILKLDDMEFLIQKRATPVFAYLDQHPDQGKKVIDSLLDVIISRKEKGIADHDINCERNLGILNGKGMLIDIGEFRPVPSKASTLEELEHATFDLKRYLENNLPDLTLYLQKNLELKAAEC